MAQAQKSNRTILIAGAIVLAIAGFVGWRYLKTRKATKKAEEEKKKAEELALLQEQQGSGNQGSGSSSSSQSSGVGSNPFKTSGELKNFQTWVIEKKKDTTILAPDGADGLWGGKSSSAWEKYGKEYLGSGSSSSSEKDAVTEAEIGIILRNGRGVKSDRNYITKSQYPSFFKAWADAISKRVKSGGQSYTTFIWYNQLYDSYFGNKVATKLLMGRKAFAKEGCKLRSNPKSSNEVQATTKDEGLGSIISWRYNVDENVFYVKTDKFQNFAWAKYNYIYTN